MTSNIQDIIGQLKAWFPPEAHKERDLPGGGKWMYIPWQAIRDRLDEVCPDWQVSYSAPQYLGDYCTITCTITIEGISKQGIGNAEIVLLSSSGKNMARGTPIERATADAFKAAAEAWGCCRYLDEQVDAKTKKDFVRYMQHAGDGRAADFYHRNEGNLPPKPDRRPPQSKPFGGGKPKLAAVPAPEPIAQTSPKSRLAAVQKSSTRDWGFIRQVIESNGFPGNSEQLEDHHVDRIRDDCYVNWAWLAYSGWQHEQHCRNSYLKVLTAIGSASDEEIWAQWSAKVMEKAREAVG